MPIRLRNRQTPSDLPTDRQRLCRYAYSPADRPNDRADMPAIHRPTDHADMLAIYKPDNDSADTPAIYNQRTIVPICIQSTTDQPIVPIRLRSTDRPIDELYV